MRYENYQFKTLNEWKLKISTFEHCIMNWKKNVRTWEENNRGANARANPSQIVKFIRIVNHEFINPAHRQALPWWHSIQFSDSIILPGLLFKLSSNTFQERYLQSNSIGSVEIEHRCEEPELNLNSYLKILSNAWTNLYSWNYPKTALKKICKFN